MRIKAKIAQHTELREQISLGQYGKKSGSQHLNGITLRQKKRGTALARSLRQTKRGDYGKKNCGGHARYGKKSGVKTALRR